MAKPEMMDLPVKLTPDELQTRAKSLAKTMRERDDLEAHRKAVVADLKNKIEEKTAQANHLAGIVHSGEEVRPVPVQTSKDFDRGTVNYIRLDTGEVVKSRPMSESERQQQMFHDLAGDEQGRRKRRPNLTVVPSSDRDSNSEDPPPAG